MSEVCYTNPAIECLAYRKSQASHQRSNKDDQNSLCTRRDAWHGGDP